jgi:hypothetical protein
VVAAAKALELAHLEALQRQLATLRNQDVPALPYTFEAEPAETRQ